MSDGIPVRRRLVVRTSQVLRAHWERWGLGRSGRLPAAAAVLRDRSANPAFFASFEDPAQTLDLLRSTWPELEAQTIARADRISDGRFDLLGYQGLSFGDPIDWHLDPVSGVRAPLAHWSRIDSLNPEEVGDHKVIWELNRHQYLVHLGKAYWYRGDERYAKRFVEHVTSWMDANPPKRGINWASSLEVALRSIAWIWCLNLFRRSPSVTRNVRLKMLRYLHVHGRHIESYLSTCFSPNTHLTGEALGLVYLGLCLPELAGAARWLRKGLRVLESEVRKQIRPDGVYFEHATYYHRYTVDIFLHLRLLAERNGIALDPGVGEKLEDALVHLMHLTRPDGRTPLVGDEDGGRLLFLDNRDPNDFRSPLATAAVLYERPDFAWVAGPLSEETLWLLGPTGVRALERIERRPPTVGSRAFRDGGFYVMRDGWEAEANYVLLRCGPHGALRGAHAHADALAFELTAGGTPVLVDSGTYDYTRDPASRDAFRCTAAHNTLTVAGESSCLPGGPFDWRRTCTGTACRWIVTERFDYFEGLHDGYRRLPRAAQHRRTILHLKGDYWVVRDVVTGAEPATVISHLHFHPSLTVEEAAENGRITLTVKGPDGDPVLQAFLFGVTERLDDGPGWVSPVYGRRLPAPVRRYAGASGERCELLSVWIPTTRCRKVGITHGAEGNDLRTLHVEGGGFVDDMLIADRGHVTWRDVEGEFGWAWLRRDAEGRVTEHAAVGVRELTASGRPLFHSEKLVAHCYGSAGRRDPETQAHPAAAGVASSSSESS